MLVTLEVPEDDSEASIKDFMEQMPIRAQRVMQSVGYYSSVVKVDRVRAGGKENPDLKVDNLRLTVVPGNPVKISKLTLSIVGDAQLDAGYMPVIAQIPIRQNAVFTHSDYEATKGVLFDRAQDRGYFDFEFTTTTVRVSRKNLTAEITLIADSGLRYSFATVEFKSDYFSDEFLRGYVPFEYGDPYESAQLAALTQQMQNTGFFSKVKVVPRRGNLFGKQVPIIIEVEKKEKNQVGIGLGFATDTEWRGKLTWTKPLVNKAGHSFDAVLGVSKINQNMSLTYRVPRSSDPLYNYWSFETGILNEELDDQKSFLSTVNVQRIKKTKREWTESLFLRWEREKYELAGIIDETDLLMPGFSYSKNRSKGFPFLTKGYSISTQFLYASKELLSSIDFYKSTVNLKYLKSVSKNDTFIFAAQYGAISTNDYDRVPSSQRFFVGGDRTIRGFPYRSLSPVNPNGEAVGGRYKEVVSLEYSHRVRNRWAAALFIDAGRAFNNFDQSYNVGAGFGLRWYSPVGPFRIDFAFGVSEKGSPFELHLSLGPDL